MAKGSAVRAELNNLFKTKCVNCGASISTETSNSLDGNEYQTKGLVGIKNGKKEIFPTCGNCYDSGFRPPGFVF